MTTRKGSSIPEVAELTSPLVEESEKDKLLRKSREQPFVPLGKCKNCNGQNVII